MTKAKGRRRIWADANKHRAFSFPWISEVARMFQSGFGVEDISIWMNCHRSWVKKQFDEFKSDGLFKVWWP